jgi:hypothetical protein
MNVSIFSEQIAAAIFRIIQRKVIKTVLFLAVLILRKVCFIVNFTPASNKLHFTYSHPPETGTDGVGNKKVTSKRDHRYQRLDGEAGTFCQ